MGPLFGVWEASPYHEHGLFRLVRDVMQQHLGEAMVREALCSSWLDSQAGHEIDKLLQAGPHHATVRFKDG